MHLYLNILGKQIPSYGLMIVTGVVLANLLAFLLYRKKDDINDVLILEAYVFLGGFIGAKVLYLLISWRQIDWSRFFQPAYFNELMLSGFVFYGGLIGGIIFCLLAGKIHHIDAVSYLRRYIFFIPFIHGFGRIGCFLAGCCYGIPYNGIGAVVFPEGSFAPAGIPLFPVQLLEAGLLFLIAFTIWLFQTKKGSAYTVELYLLLYGIVRFFMEFLRDDAERGHLGIFSTSQWISIVLVAVSILSLLYRHKARSAKSEALAG